MVLIQTKRRVQRKNKDICQLGRRRSADAAKDPFGGADEHMPIRQLQFLCFSIRSCSVDTRHRYTRTSCRVQPPLTIDFPSDAIDSYRPRLPRIPREVGADRAGQYYPVRSPRGVPPPPTGTKTTPLNCCQPPNTQRLNGRS